MNWIRSAWGGLRTVLAGAAVGVANVIPGVSGGTMAVILGVFDRMVEALGLKNLRKNIGFLILFGLGAGGGVLAFSGLIKWLLEHYPTATAAVFFGLVLGSIPMIFRRAGGRAFRPAELVPLCGGIAVMVGFMLLQNHAGAGDTAGAQALTLPLALTLFAVCAVSTVAMILPGISGSAMLVIFGQYYTVIGAISAVADVLRGQLTLA